MALTATKAFKAAFGITPDEYRTNSVHLNQMVKPELLLHYTLIDENMPLVTDSIVLEISRTTLNNAEFYVGLSGQVPLAQQIPLGEATVIDVPGMPWDKFHTLKSRLEGLTPNGVEFAASSVGRIAGHFTYFVGASAGPEAKASGDIFIWHLAS